MLVIIDYGMGNVGSILNMIKKVGGDALITSKPEEIEKAKKIIIPGVGSFDKGMSNLQDMGIINVLNKKVMDENTPVLGICLGMQLMTKKSEEGILSGLGWINAHTVRFIFDLDRDLNRYKIPHMGWNDINIKKDSLLFEDMEADPRYYFVHSYHVVCHEEEDVLTTTNYGVEFISSFQKGNIYGTQFHPEKSHKYGIKLMRNFVELVV